MMTIIILIIQKKKKITIKLVWLSQMDLLHTHTQHTDAHYPPRIFHSMKIFFSQSVSVVHEFIQIDSLLRRRSKLYQKKKRNTKKKQDNISWFGLVWSVVVAVVDCMLYFSLCMFYILELMMMMIQASYDCSLSLSLYSPLLRTGWIW